MEKLHDFLKPYRNHIFGNKKAFYFMNLIEMGSFSIGFYIGFLNPMGI